jgi:hypothetical protein
MPVNRPGQPGAETIGIPAFPQSPPYPEDGILTDILRQVQVGHDRVGHGQGRACVAGEEHAKGKIVAGAGAGEKSRIGAGIGLRRR